MLYGLSGDPFYNLWVFAQLAGAKLQVSFAFPNPDPNHFILPTQPLIDFQAKILTKLFGAVNAYNIFIFISFVLTFIAAYLLAKKLTKNRWAAILSALIITSLPYRLAQSQVHPNLASTHWLLFFIYFLISLKEKPGWKYGLFVGIFGGLTVLDNYQYAFVALVIAAVFVLAALIEAVAKKKWRDFGKFFSFGLVSLAIAFVLLAAFDLKLINSLISGGNLTNLGPKRDFAELSVYSARWFYYLLPSPFLSFGSNLFRGGFEQIQALGTNTIEQTLFVGWLPLILAILGLFSWRRHKENFFLWFFLLLALVAFLFSFAPEFNLFGLKIHSPAFYFFEKFPIIRVYARFGLIVGISVGVLAGYGFKYLTQKAILRLHSGCPEHGRTGKAIAPWLFALAIIIVAIEFLPKNIIPIQKVDQSPLIDKTLAQLPPGPLAEYPLLPSDEPSSYDYLVGQLFHRDPLLYGATVGSEADKLRKELLDPSSAQTIARLQGLGVKYIIVHGDKYTPELIRKYPAELTDGRIPEINDTRVNLISCVQEKCLYEIK